MDHSDRTAKMLGQPIGPSGRPADASQYELVSLLGQQTGRRTFLATDARTQKKVVVKLLLFGPDFTWEDLKLFEREAETLRSLDYAAIPKYLDSFEVETALGKGFVLVQTYIEAQSLQEWMTSGRRFSESDLKELAQSILVILQYLHSRHPAVVHRDIKPSNILLADRTAHSIGKVYLVDFGSVQVAHHGGTMTIVGTYGYMPPEQFGGRAKPTSDLYSLGATLVYLATGQHPADFVEDSLEKAVSTQLNVSRAFARWIQQITVANAAQRTASAAIALHDLSRIQPNQSTYLHNFVEHKLTNGSVQKVTPSIVNLQESSSFVSVAESAFQVELTAKTLTVRFDQNRIQENLEFIDPYTKTTGTSKARFSFSVALSIVFFVALLIISASGATAGIALLFSVFFIVIVTVWAVSASSDSFDDKRTAVMTLNKSQHHMIYLTVEVLQVLAGNEPSQRKVMRSPTQFTNVPLQAVKILPDSANSYASFIFSGKQKIRHPSIKIAGNRRRLTSLLRYINQWDSSLVDLTREPLTKNLLD